LIVGATGGRLIAGEALKPLDRSHPPAQALSFVDDAADADPAVYKEGSRCDNCLHFRADAAPGESGGCALFPGFSVPAAGWCAGWVADQQ
jgi:hypothetical protein